MSATMSYLGRLARTVNLVRCTGARSILEQPRRYLPVCTFDTNLDASNLPKDFHLKLSKQVATTLDKDEKNVAVTVNTSQMMCKEGDDGPLAVLNICSIGVFDKERNPRYSKELYDFLMPALSLKPNRISILFHPINKETAGHLLYSEMTSQ